MLRKDEVAEPGDAITPEQAIKDPFVLEFLNLKDEYSESDLEEALIQHLADFLLELGDDFAFIGRQRRLRLLRDERERSRVSHGEIREDLAVDLDARGLHAGLLRQADRLAETLANLRALGETWRADDRRAAEIVTEAKQATVALLDALRRSA